MRRKITLPLLLTVCFITISFLITNSKIDSSNGHDKVENYEEKEGENAGEYIKYLNSLRVNPATGKLELDDILNGRREVMLALQKAGSRGRSILDLTWEHMGPNNVGGRTRTIAFDKGNPSRMYAGSVSGGLFISDNGGLDWYPSPANETLAALSVTSIAVATNGDIYIGGGESQASYFDGSGSYSPGFPGNGIYKSTDNGMSFTLLEDTEPTPGTLGGNSGAWTKINRIACHPTDANKLVAAQNSGLWYSEDAGDSWSACSAGSAMSGFVASDVTFDVNGNVHAVYNNKYYKTVSSSDITEYNQLGSGLPSGIGRMNIAIAPSDPNYSYAYAISSSTSEMLGIYRSTDGGASFSAISTAGGGLFNDLNGQGYWNICIVVNPVDRDRVYIGGTFETYTWRASTAAWTPMSAWFYPEFFSKYIHADVHFMIFNPNDTEGNTMYVGSDGGVSRTLNAQDDYPDFQTMNTGYSTYQANGVGFGLFGDPIGGSQDNGTQYVNFLESSALQAIGVLGGDGSRGEVSRIRTDYLFGAVYFGDMRRSVNAGNTSSNILDCNIDKLGGTGTGACNPNGLPDNGGEFMPVFKLWENWDLYETFKSVLFGGTVEYPVGSGSFYVLNDVVNYEGRDITLTKSGISESRLYLATNSNLWVTDGALFNSTEAAEWFKILPSTFGIVSSIEFDNSGNTVYVGTATGRLYRLDGLLTADLTYIDDVFDPALAGITSFLYPEIFPVGGSAARITAISINRDNPDELVLSTAGYGVDDNVWHTTNALTDSDAVFVSLANELPNVPVFGILMEMYNSNYILAATEFGVWSYDISTGGDWTQETSLIGSVPVLEIREGFIRDQDCKAIYIGSHGRGFFRATNLAAGTCDFALVNDSADVNSDSPIQEEIIAGIVLTPNPADISADANLTLAKAANITTKMYTMGGVLVRSFGTAAKPIGASKITLGVSDVLPGAYLVVFEAEGGATVSRKLMVY
ncbi:MAG: hypothetical protein H7Y00_14155 [Fimbriimonadaceae bacterium]|nr:hypothetical protein [Chitinophagales bacterium]